MIGMTADEYWHGDPYLAKAYRKAYKKRIEARNQELWLQGKYVFDAVSVALYNAFRGRRAAAKYTEKPYQIFPKTRAEIEREARIEREKIVKNLEAMRKAWGQKHGNHD